MMEATLAHGAVVFETIRWIAMAVLTFIAVDSLIGRNEVRSCAASLIVIALYLEHAL